MLPFLDRSREFSRLSRALDARGFAVLWGRRRVGKSRLLRKALEGRLAIFYVADERDSALQREALAREAAALIPGFDRVAYPSWEPLFDRLFRESPPGAVLAIDEIPFLVSAAPEIPSLLQKQIDAGPRIGVVACGSSQAMMHGLVLDAAAPLYGRAQELIRVAPLGAHWLGEALRVSTPEDVLRRWAVAGGIPRYWELLSGFADFEEALRDLFFDPLGTLFREPDHVLKDDYRDPRKAMSILALVGSGCHRPSEISARLGEPATSLVRPLGRLVELGLIRREVPFGQSPRDGKRTRYRIDDPLLAFWYAFVEPNRSRIEAGLGDVVARQTIAALPRHLGDSWEVLVRQAVPRLEIDGARFEPAQRFWRGSGAELDAVASSVDDPNVVLVVEAKLSLTAEELPREIEGLRRRANLPELEGKKKVFAVASPSVGTPWTGADIIRALD
ncbi:MAG: ATP-binding protein [Deltaproteobacteria bacterium]|nr:ATP-binding protein [Deltaproteobacteria bacterium]